MAGGGGGGEREREGQTHERADRHAGGDGGDGARAHVAGYAACCGQEGEEEGLGGGVGL